MSQSNNKPKKASIFSKEIMFPAMGQSFVKLNPKDLIRNPVMFCVFVVTILCSIYLIDEIIKAETFSLTLQITLWLWFTIIFANFAEAVAEGKGKAQAQSLKETKSKLKAKKISAIETKDNFLEVAAESLKIGDLIVISQGDLVPSDGDVIFGIATIDESAITGESAPVIREAGGDKSAVTAGTQIISDEIIVKVTANPGESFLDRMISLVENAKRQKTPNEIALTILLSGLTLIFIVTVFSIYGLISYSNTTLSVVLLVALFITLIPTTIAGLLSAIGISGMDRLLKANVIALSGRAVESSGNIDVLLLDKTGTITLGNRFAEEFIVNEGISEKELAYASWLSSLSDKTPEGRSIVKLAEKKFQFDAKTINLSNIEFIPFSAYTRTSGVLIKKDQKITEIKKGASSAIEKYIFEKTKQRFSQSLEKSIEFISEKGGTPLVVIQNDRVLGVIYLKDVIKPGIKEKFIELCQMGIKTVMITGDNPLTAAAIAAEAGVDDFVSEASPEEKLAYIQKVQKEGKMVAMCGDGTNDAPALAQADVGVAMATGTQAAREAGNMVDLDSDPKKLIDIIKIGKQILMTRGALTTFSITNDIAKYFAIIPALFIGAYPKLEALNIMRLSSPSSAILSAVIFNAIIIIFLIPMALKGVKNLKGSASVLLRRNLYLYGVGGIVVPFIGIKIIDILIQFLHLA